MNATHLGRTPEREAVPIDCSVDPGCGVVDGVEMLVPLAMQLFNLWAGIVPEEEVFQKAVAVALGE